MSLPRSGLFFSVRGSVRALLALAIALMGLRFFVRHSVLSLGTRVDESRPGRASDERGVALAERPRLNPPGPANVPSRGLLVGQ